MLAIWSRTFYKISGAIIGLLLLAALVIAGCVVYARKKPDNMVNRMSALPLIKARLARDDIAYEQYLALKRTICFDFALPDEVDPEEFVYSMRVLGYPLFGLIDRNKLLEIASNEIEKEYRLASHTFWDRQDAFLSIGRSNLPRARGNEHIVCALVARDSRANRQNYEALVGNSDNYDPENAGRNWKVMSLPLTGLLRDRLFYDGWAD